jgi:CDP-diacylglycerol--inositol 3-phosphatidyltransferase
MDGKRFSDVIVHITGFARVFLALGAFWTASDDPVTTFWLYFWSCFLDALDGHAARAFNQSMP